MRYSIFFISLTLIVILGVACKKSSKLDTELIPVFTGTIDVDVSFKSVSFLAHFEKLDPDEIEDCGFEWIESNQSTVFLVSGSKIANGSFSATAPQELNRNANYKASAWIKVRGKRILSKPVGFSGSVTQKAEILSVNRSYALFGDTIKIKMKNLTPELLPKDINVVFWKSLTKPVQANPYEISLDEIAVIMPADCPPGTFKVEVIINNQESLNDFLIENAFPQIKSLSKSAIYFHETTVLQGKFWPEYANRVFPVIGSTGIKFEIISYSKDQIVIKIPDEAACISKEFFIGLKAIDPNSVKSFQFAITDFKLFWLDKHWEINSYTRLPQKSKVIYLNDQFYALELNSNNSNTNFTRYNVLLSSTMTLQKYPAPTNNNPGIVVCNNEIYAGFERGADQSSNFYKYNVQNDTWSECANMPVPVEATGYITTVIDNKIYVLLKQTNEKCIYDPVSGLWTRSSCTIPDFNSTAQMFDYNGEHYLFKGLEGNLLYKYDTSMDTFSPVIIDGLDNIDNIFNINNTYYCTVGCRVYVLDISGKALIDMPEFGNQSYEQYGNISFFLATKYKAIFDTGSINFSEEFTP